MITPILMLVMMTAPYGIARALNAWAGRSYDLDTAGATGLGILFVFTGSGHFLQTATMAQMLPPIVPGRVPLVYLTGLLEWAIAVGLFVPRTREFSGLAAAVVLIAFFPANVYAAFRHMPMGGHEWGPVYLLIRGPVQVAILLWVCRFTIRPGGAEPRGPAAAIAARLYFLCTMQREGNT